jgi:hypothetical protein
VLVVKKNHIRGDRDWEHTQYSGASFAEGFLRSPPATNCCSAGLNLTGSVRVPFLFSGSPHSASFFLQRVSGFPFRSETVRISCPSP